MARRILLLLTLASLSLTSHAFAQQTNSETSPISLCQLAQNADKYDGAFVRVRGTWHVGGHGIFLRSDCGSGSPTFLWIVNIPSEYQNRGLDSTAFSEAEFQIGTARSEARDRTGRDLNSIGAVVTYEGLFEHKVGGPGGSLVAGWLFVRSIDNIETVPAEPKDP